MALVQRLRCASSQCLGADQRMSSRDWRIERQRKQICAESAGR
jgi:hypothetical protein